jgi:2-hydroxy-4-carboxymuconate semialdehyde hemiacetal dehydrogenase
VILANPSEQHAASAELVLAHGKHLLVEIPLAMSLTEAEALVAGADERALELGVVHPLRARVELVALRERLRRGDERLRVVHGRFFTHRLVNVGATGYARSWTDNLLWHHVAHLVDAALWLADAPATRVESWMAPIDVRTGTPMEVSLIAETAGPPAISVTASYSAHEHVFDLMAVTDVDSYRLDVRASTLTSRAGTVEIEAEEANCARVTRDFVRAVRERRDPLVTGRSVLPAMAVLEQVQRAWDARYGAQSLPGRPLT